MSNKTDNVSSFFESYAERFDSIYGTKNNIINRIINRLFRKSMMIRFNKTIEGCTHISGKTVLDIGTGPGHYAVKLALLGADLVVGIDFAEDMIAIARKRAENAGVGSICNMIHCDFFSYNSDDKYDYVIAMGFMDYIVEQEKAIEKILAMTKRKAFFSFPAKGGILAWQRKIRYKKRCVLVLYSIDDILRLFGKYSGYTIRNERIGRDYFVTVEVK